MNESKVGVIGFGFVGEAQAFAFSPISNVKVYDIDKRKSTNSLEETLKCKFIFVCVPTPMKKMESRIHQSLKMYLKKQCQGQYTL